MLKIVQFQIVPFKVKIILNVMLTKINNLKARGIIKTMFFQKFKKC